MPANHSCKSMSNTDRQMPCVNDDDHDDDDNDDDDDGDDDGYVLRVLRVGTEGP